MKIDLSFRVQGATLFADHAYSLFSALCRVIPDLHEEDKTQQTGVFVINGSLIGKRKIRITNSSRLVLRVAAERIPRFIALSGAKLELGQDTILLGVPEIHALKPSPNLSSRIVSIRNGTHPDGFLSVVKEQFTDLGISSAQPKLSFPVSESRVEKATESHRRTHLDPIRRTVQIAEQVIVGFAVEVDGLSPVDSIKLQESGIGGRRHFGCGLFLPKKSL